MKNPKSRTQKKSAQASRTMTRQSALKDINSGLDKMNLMTSDLEAHQIPDLNLNLADTEVFEIQESECEQQTPVQSKAEPENSKNSVNVDKNSPFPVASNAQNQPPSRMTLPPKPFTIISSFRK